MTDPLQVVRPLAEGALVIAALAPIHRVPDLTGELFTQAPLGHRLALLEAHDPFYRVRLEDDSQGWVHKGYLAVGPDEWAADWEEEAHATSLGAIASAGGRFRCLLPLGARVALHPDGGITLPDGRLAAIASGRVASDADLRTEALAVAPAEWAAVFFAGAPYLWGGVTAWGVDAAALVQLTYRVRGVPLPRELRPQYRAGLGVGARDAAYPFESGDLLFFAEERGSLSPTHVAIADGAGAVVHSLASAGGVCRSPLAGRSAEAEWLRASFLGARRVRSASARARRA